MALQTELDLDTEFINSFGVAAEGKVRAPGRVCLIGEHADYNRGFVLPFALDMAVTVSFKVRRDTQVRVRSLLYPDYMDSFDVARDVSHCPQAWANYVRGVFYITKQYGFPYDNGLDLLISSTLPTDAGLASSGAMSTAVAGTLKKALALPISMRSLALIAEKAENEFFGRACGIMDPLAATSCKTDNLLLIDCKDFKFKQIPLPDDLAVVVFNSCAHKDLQGHEFNELRKACERAAFAMDMESLRSATLSDLESCKYKMDDTAYRCAFHIITENERTLQLVDSLSLGDYKAVYQLMNESYDSVRDNFRNTIPEIDALVKLCRSQLRSNVGVRMTGGGYGGSVIALCRKDDALSLKKAVVHQYMERFGIMMPTYICRPGSGLQVAWAQHNRDVEQVPLAGAA